MPATPEIYTYCHTLALPEGLPICRLRLRLRGPQVAAADGGGKSRRDGRIFLGRHGLDPVLGRSGEPAHRGLLRPDDPRSAEHTSALQSLIRLSYAAFCLKKKNSHTSIASSNARLPSYPTQK